MSSHAQDVSRAGAKLAAALDAFSIDPTNLVCADLGSNAGGFVECLLRRGARRVYAVERGYGVLDLRLRKDERVVVRERTDALTVHLPEPIDLVTVDVGWTRQNLILPAAMRVLAPRGRIISLVKPHYEAKLELLSHGVLPDEEIEEIIRPLRERLASLGLTFGGEIESPIRGHGGNAERLWLLLPKGA